jgi:hypothetical protein
LTERLYEGNGKIEDEIKGEKLKAVACVILESSEWDGGCEPRR